MVPFTSLYMKEIHEAVCNPEIFIKYAYLQVNLTVLNSPKIRGLEKFDRSEWHICCVVCKVRIAFKCKVIYT